MTVAVMKTTMTRTEIVKWLSYYTYKQPDITEIQLATIGVLVSAGLGNKNAKIDDFLVSKGNTKPQDPTEVMQSDEVAGFFGMLT